MLLIHDITRADYPVVEELLDSNDLGIGGAYSPEGQEVVVAELHGSVVGVAEFQLDCGFGRDEGRPDHPREQAWLLTMAVADAHRHPPAVGPSENGGAGDLVPETSMPSASAGADSASASSSYRAQWVSSSIPRASSDSPLSPVKWTAPLMWAPS